MCWVEEMFEIIFKRARVGEIAAVKLFLQSRGGGSSKTQLEIKDDSPKLNIDLQFQIRSDSLNAIEPEVVDESSENKTGLNLDSAVDRLKDVLTC